MEILKNTNFDFIGKKRPFIIVSLVLIAASTVSLAVKGGPKWGIDFKGGAVMYVKFAGTPPVAQIRSSIGAQIPGAIEVQELTGENEVMIGTELMDDAQLDRSRNLMVQTLTNTFGDPQSGKLDFNNAGRDEIFTRLRDPLQRKGVAVSEEQLRGIVDAMFEFRTTPPRSGLITSFDQLSAVPGVTPAMIETLKEEAYLAPFAVRQVEVVGPKVGADLRQRALWATLAALGGMLVYIAFRFEWIYGVAAVIAVAHDAFITVGFFSIFDKEISLTVVAALLTLVGYSMNDTIVIFDRIRENLKILRREPFDSLINKSINQTLARTIMTSGLTFLTVLSLFLFGGDVLNPFSFALVVGIIIGTYSTMFIASPIVLFWHDYAVARKRTRSVAAPKTEVRRSSEKVVK